MHCRYGGVDLWVWNTGKPLLQRPMPPFIFGRSRYDNWLTHELAQVSPGWSPRVPAFSTYLELRASVSLL